MSDLHKLFLRRVKQQEQTLGLGLLAEEPDSSSSQSSASVSPLPSLSPVQSSDPEIHHIYTSAKINTFPVIDRYHDSQRDVVFQTYYRPPSSADAPIFVCHHGAGSSAMTFCVLTTTFSQVCDPAPGVFAFDMRGHGSSTDTELPQYDRSTLVDDFAFVLDQFVSTHKPGNSIYLVGHSLGGAVLTEYLMRHSETTHSIRGLAMVDIVEETAVKALAAMPQFLRNRPVSFPNYTRAIDWHTKHIRLLHNRESATISIPDLLVKKEDGLFWKTNLVQTQPFWDTWFTDLSKNFIECGAKKKIAKLLILSGHETLDTNLIIGQMQGKYQLIVFNNTAESGHFLQEDIPNHMAISLNDFVRRNDSPDEYMKKEFGFVPKWGGKINK